MFYKTVKSVQQLLIAAFPLLGEQNAVPNIYVNILHRVLSPTSVNSQISRMCINGSLLL